MTWLVDKNREKLKRVLKHRLVKYTIEKIRQIPCSRALEISIKNECHRIPFVKIFKPIFQYRIYLKSFPVTLTFFVLHNDVQKHFPLFDILVSAKHRGQFPPQPPKPQPASGTFCCHRNGFKTCPFITEGTTFYTFFSINEQRRTRDHISCSSVPISFR